MSGFQLPSMDVAAAAVGVAFRSSTQRLRFEVALLVCAEAGLLALAFCIARRDFT